jgi:hypothetical protein
MQLKNRKLLFLCEGCKNDFGEVPVLIKAVSEIRNEVLKLQRSSLTRGNDPSKDMENNHDIINEIEERIKRRKNVIIANIKESQKVNVHEKKRNKNTFTYKDYNGQDSGLSSRKIRCTRTAVSGQKPNNPTPELPSKNFNLPGRL